MTLLQINVSLFSRVSGLYSFTVPMKSSINTKRYSKAIFKSALCVLCLMACSEKPAKWIPVFLLKEVKVFSRIDGTQHQLLFSALPGEVCELRENVEGKVFLNTRIRCNLGEGWAQLTVDDYRIEVSP